MDRQKRSVSPTRSFRQKSGLVVLLALLLTSLGLAQVQAERPKRKSRRNTNTVKVILPRPRLSGSLSVEQVLVSENTVSQIPSAVPLDVTDIGQLAWSALGVNPMVQAGNLRTDPLAGVELLFVTAQGSYKYQAQGHSLEQLSANDMRIPLTLTAFGQQAPATGCGIIIAKSTTTRGSRQNSKVKRLQHLKVGAMAQILKMQATSLGMITLEAGDFDENLLRRAVGLARTVEPLHILLMGYRPGRARMVGIPDASQDPAITPGSARTGPRKAIFVVPTVGFQDIELADTARILAAAGIETVIAALRVGPVQGMLGTTAQAAVQLKGLDVESYDAVIFIGGSGAGELLNNPIASSIASEAIRKGKIVGAIDMAPSILAKADLLKGIRVTGYPTEQKKLIAMGAIYTGTTVERDQQIITASGPAASARFGQVLSEAIFGR